MKVSFQQKVRGIDKHAVKLNVEVYTKNNKLDVIMYI